MLTISQSLPFHLSHHVIMLVHFFLLSNLHIFGGLGKLFIMCNNVLIWEKNLTCDWIWWSLTIVCDVVECDHLWMLSGHVAMWSHGQNVVIQKHSLWHVIECDHLGKLYVTCDRMWPSGEVVYGMWQNGHLGWLWHVTECDHFGKLVMWQYGYLGKLYVTSE